jgi:hypothetical protein
VISPSQRLLPAQNNTTYTHKRLTSMLRVGFELAISATKRLQTYALDMPVYHTGTSFCSSISYQNLSIHNIPIYLFFFFIFLKAFLVSPQRSVRRRSSSWLLGSWVRIPLEAWMFVYVFLCCVVLCRSTPLRRADHSSKGVLPRA